MRFGIRLSILTLIKSSYNTFDISKLFFGISGYIYSFITAKEPIVSLSEGKFIRNYRWDSFKKILFKRTKVVSKDFFYINLKFHLNLSF